jgi:hypothetical protein
MAEIKNTKELPLMMEDLTHPERIFLAQIYAHAGFKVLIKLLNASCARATEQIVKLDPEKPDYERLLPYRSQRSRNFSECVSEVMKSVEFHTGALRAEEVGEEVQAEDAVSKVFGIHKVPPKAKKVIGQLQESSKEKQENKSVVKEK